jgi:hypothetical protein
MGRPGNLLIERELQVQPELLILRVQINPLGRAEDEVLRRHRQEGVGHGPVVGIDLNRAG